MLFADETIMEVTNTFLGIPNYFGTMILCFVFFSGIAVVGAFLFWRVADWVTPGKLNDELVPPPVEPGTLQKQPNIALALVVGSMFVGGCLLLGLIAHGILTH